MRPAPMPEYRPDRADEMFRQYQQEQLNKLLQQIDERIDKHFAERIYDLGGAKLQLVETAVLALRDLLIEQGLTTAQAFDLAVDARFQRICRDGLSLCAEGGTLPREPIRPLLSATPHTDRGVRRSLGARKGVCIQARQQAGRKNATIKNELAILRRAFRLAADDEKIARVPKFPKLEVDNARQGFFEAHEYRAVLAELPDDLRPLIIAMYHTGWRTGELLRLEWSQVDFEAGIIRLEVRTTKNNKGREFPFAALPELAEMLQAQWAATKALGQRQGRIIRPVFHREGQPIRSFRHAWQAAVIRAALPGRLPHDLRRTAVRNLVRAGVSEKVAMTLTGHQTRAVFDRYDIVNEADLRGAVEKLAARPPERGAPGQVISLKTATERRSP